MTYKNGIEVEKRKKDMKRKLQEEEKEEDPMKGINGEKTLKANLISNIIYVTWIEIKEIE